MTLGVFIDGERPASRRALVRAIREDARQVAIEDAESYGLAPEMPADSIDEGEEVEVCGPDPYAERVWTATIVKSNGRVIVR